MKMSKWYLPIAKPFAILLLAAHATYAAVPSPKPPNPQTGAPRTPIFSAEVEIVTVDVVVADKKGVPVSGLRKEDFLLYEDDAPQKITRFERMELPEEPSAVTPQRPPVSTNMSPTTDAGRTFAVAFDDVQLDAFQGHRAKLAIAEFLRTGVRNGDRVTLFATSGAVWWTAEMESGRDDLMAILKRVDGRRFREMNPLEHMSEYEALRIHVFNDTVVGQQLQTRFEESGAIQNTGSEMEDSDRYVQGGMIHPYVAMRALDIYQQSATRNRITLNALTRALESLAVIRGRKALILVSEGFVYDTQLDGFKDVTRAARESNVAIYFLDTRGLGGSISPYSADFGGPVGRQDFGALFTDQTMAAEGAEFLATESGGFSIKNTNDLEGGILRIANESRSYYLLGYSSTNALRDGRYRKIDVKINRRGVVVRARRGYYAPLESGEAVKAAEDEESDPQIRKALDSPFDIDGIPLRMSAGVFEEKLLGRARVVVAADVDLRKLEFSREEERFVDALEVVLLVVHRESGEIYQYAQTIKMRLKPETFSSKNWYPLLREFELPSGAYQARLVVRDNNTRRLSSVMHSFDVPPLDSWRISTPIVSDTLTDDPEGKRAEMRARRTFLRQGMVYCHFEVYGAAKDPATGMPRVSQGYKIIRADGGLERFVQTRRITPSTSGTVSRLFGFSLAALKPGNYEIVLTVMDELQGQVKELHEPFVVVRDSADL
jgi:VWFA-related protein